MAEEKKKINLELETLDSKQVASDGVCIDDKDVEHGTNNAEMSDKDAKQADPSKKPKLSSQDLDTMLNNPGVPADKFLLGNSELASSIFAKANNNDMLLLTDDPKNISPDKKSC